MVRSWSEGSRFRLSRICATKSWSKDASDPIPNSDLRKLSILVAPLASGRMAPLSSGRRLSGPCTPRNQQGGGRLLQLMDTHHGLFASGILEVLSDKYPLPRRP